MAQEKDCGAVAAAAALTARDKNKNQIVTAIGRELLGFIWAIGIETEKQLNLSKAA